MHRLAQTFRPAALLLALAVLATACEIDEAAPESPPDVDPPTTTAPGVEREVPTTTSSQAPTTTAAPPTTVAPTTTAAPTTAPTTTVAPTTTTAAPTTTTTAAPPTTTVPPATTTTPPTTTSVPSADGGPDWLAYWDDPSDIIGGADAPPFGEDGWEFVFEDDYHFSVAGPFVGNDVALAFCVTFYEVPIHDYKLLSYDTASGSMQVAQMSNGQVMVYGGGTEGRTPPGVLVDGVRTSIIVEYGADGYIDVNGAVYPHTAESTPTVDNLRIGNRDGWRSPTHTHHFGGVASGGLSAADRSAIHTACAG